MKLGAKTDIEAGTITSADAGSTEEERQSLFNPCTQICGGPGARADSLGAPNCIRGGFVISRSVEYTARKAGVRFMLNRHMDEIIREGGDSGRVIGVKASYTPRISPVTGKRLESYWSNGNIDETKQVIYVRARRAVIVGTGGYMGNVPFRTSFDPRMSEPSMQYGTGLMGPLHEDASGILAGMKVGAGLGGLYQANLHANTALRLQPVLAVSDVYDRVMPGTRRSSSSVPTASRSAPPAGNTSLPSTKSASASTTSGRSATSAVWRPNGPRACQGPKSPSPRAIGGTPAWPMCARVMPGDRARTRRWP